MLEVADLNLKVSDLRSGEIRLTLTPGLWLGSALSSVLPGWYIPFLRKCFTPLSLRGFHLSSRSEDKLLKRTNSCLLLQCY